MYCQKIKRQVNIIQKDDICNLELEHVDDLQMQRGPIWLDVLRNNTIKSC